ncbi:MAG: hypothetical protein SGI88_16700 [Candidatus Hydrogenedentes bacterium]|nr:hypothetical protein [Candidatus Hydrogenedentota bacterium]
MLPSRCPGFAILAFGIACAFSAIGDPPQKVRVDAKLFYAKPLSAPEVNTLRVTDPGVSFREIPKIVTAPVIASIESGKLELTGLTVEIKDGEVTWNSRDTGATTISEPSALVTPNIITLLDEPAEIKVVQSVPYFVRNNDGTFVLKATDAAVRFECIVSQTPDEDSVSVDWKSVMQRVASRKAMEGVRLEIGEPVFATASTEQRMVVKLGTWSAIVHMAGDGGHVIALVRVMRHTETGEGK